MDSGVERMVFPDWKPKVFQGVPFLLVDPQGDQLPNAIMLKSPNGQIPPKMPESVTLSCQTAAKSIHLLSGVSGCGSVGVGGVFGGASSSSVERVATVPWAGLASSAHSSLRFSLTTSLVCDSSTSICRPSVTTVPFLPMCRVERQFGVTTTGSPTARLKGEASFRPGRI